jgi:hypothetical protein
LLVLELIDHGQDALSLFPLESVGGFSAERVVGVGDVPAEPVGLDRGGGAFPPVTVGLTRWSGPEHGVKVVGRVGGELGGADAAVVAQLGVEFPQPGPRGEPPHSGPPARGELRDLGGDGLLDAAASEPAGQVRRVVVVDVVVQPVVADVGRSVVELVGEPAAGHRDVAPFAVEGLRIVTALQGNGEVVAVTGDGVNDASALKRADIGVAMGASGTDVAREAADLVLLDDDFALIVAAIEECRAVYANVRKFTGYIFTSNTPEAVPFVLFGLSGGAIPIALPVMHILTVDLGTDLVPALGLAAERPEPGLMEVPPRAREEHLVTAGLLRRSYLWLGPAQAAVTMGAFLLAYRAMGVHAGWLELPSSGPVYASATAAALAAVVTTQIGNLFAHRTERSSIRSVGWRGTRLLWVGVAAELAVIAAVVYLPALQAVIGTAPFPAWLWLPLLAAAPVLLLIDEARKMLLRYRTRHSEVPT